MTHVQKMVFTTDRRLVSCVFTGSARVHNKLSITARCRAMTFIIFAIMIFLIILVFRKYKTIASVIITILAALLITTTVLAAGLFYIDDNQFLLFFNSTIGRNELYHLMAAWYGADIICSMLIIKSHIAYRRINTPHKN